MKLRPKRTGTRLFALGTVISALGLLAASPASAATVQVSGVQLAATTPPTPPSAPCTAMDPMFTGTPAQENVMTGSLAGCWYTDTLVINPAQPNGTPGGTIQATGTEHFVGCLDVDGDGSCADDPTGSLAFTFQFSGKFDPVTGAEIFGRCDHPVISGTGDFAGANGVINFKDDVANGTSLYTGHVVL